VIALLPIDILRGSTRLMEKISNSPSATASYEMNVVKFALNLPVDWENVLYPGGEKAAFSAEFEVDIIRPLVGEGKEVDYLGNYGFRVTQDTGIFIFPVEYQARKLFEMEFFKRKFGLKRCLDVDILEFREIPDQLEFLKSKIYSY
jgi:hypothetical protein